MSFANYQSWEVLQDWDVGETRNINGTINEKTYQDDNRIEFRTLIPPLVYFSEHWHDFYEECKIIEGFFHDKLKSNKIYKPGESILYDPNDLHIPGNPSDVSTCLIRVIFKK